ncbi:MAG: YggT family protein [Micrococcales bacterium]
MYWLAAALSIALGLYFWVLLGRFVLDLVLSVNPRWRPRGLGLVIAELVMTLTDPPLRFLRRFIKPLRLGAISIDFAWTILVILIGAATNWVWAIA